MCLCLMYFCIVPARANEMPTCRVFDPLPINVTDAFLSFIWSPFTVKSHISCALAPVAYINESRTLSLNPVSYLSSGSANTLLTADC